MFHIRIRIGKNRIVTVPQTLVRLSYPASWGVDPIYMYVPRWEKFCGNFQKKSLCVTQKILRFLTTATTSIHTLLYLMVSTKPFEKYVQVNIYIYIYLYIYTPKPGRAPTRQYSVLSCFFPSRPASDFFGISRSVFFLRFQPIKCIRLKSISKANSTCSFGTSNTILFKCCQHFKESRTACVKYVPKQSIP